MLKKNLAKCHPDKVLYGKTGVCYLCYTRQRYKNPEIRAKILASGNSWKKRNRQKVTSYMLMHRYGITLAEYEQMKVKQDNLCALCKVKPNKLVVDHCHTTGRVRGLLCGSCNLRLVLFDDDLSMLEKVREYVGKN